MIQRTTLASYEKNIRPKKTSLEAQIRRLLTIYPDGLTNKEMAKLLEKDASTISGIVRPLVVRKDVYEAGERPCRVTGNQAKVWRLSSPFIANTTASHTLPGMPPSGTISLFS